MTDEQNSSPTAASQSLTETVSLVIPQDAAGSRLDATLASLLPDLSRGRVQALLKDGLILVDGAPAGRALKLRGGEQITVKLEAREETHWSPEPIPLAITFEDEDVLVVDKPAGLVVHPGAGNASGTLANAVLAACPQTASLPRGGIVHRLDKDTTGLMVVAKTELAHRSLVAQLSERQVKREYLALVRGTPTGGGCVDAPLGRHPRDRKRMHVVSDGRHAVTHYRIETRLGPYTLLRVNLETGRTHQIRVHMSHLGMPLIGDPVYGGRPRPVAGLAPNVSEVVHAFRRQALHATRLEFVHPRADSEVTFDSPLPADFRYLVDTLSEATDAGDAGRTGVS